MKQRIWIYVTGLLLLALACFVLFRNSEDASKSEVLSNSPSYVGDQRENGLRATERDKASSRVDRPKRFLNKEFEFAAVELLAPPEKAAALVYPQYRVGGTSGGKLTIRNSKGVLILRGNDKVSVYAAKGSPNGKMVWVLSGNGKSFVIKDSGEKLIDLPQFPLGKDMHAFSRWHWIDDNNLLGESGVQKYDEKGKLVTCCGGDNVSESRFYVYDLRTEKMEEMQLPENLRGKVVAVGKVLKTGELQLGHEGDGFGWYQVVDLGEE